MSDNHHYNGLTDAQVLESRERYGRNVLTPPAKATLWDRMLKACRHWIAVGMAGLFVVSAAAAALLAGSMGAAAWVMPGIVMLATLLIIAVGFFGGFSDPLFRILITAFVLSMGISIYEYEWGGEGFSVFFEPIGIIVALLLATGVAFFLERSNEKTFQSLNEVNDDTPVKVVRNGNVSQVARRDIVVGDVVLLEAGEEVPADCELLESLRLLVNESALTGEPMASKAAAAPGDSALEADSTYPPNHVMKGTTIMEGNCTARVLAVGDATESGRVFVAAQVEEGDPTPLSRKLDTLAAWITRASYAVAAMVVVGRIIAFFLFGSEAPFSWLDFVAYLLSTIMIAVTLIVVAVPEGLPMSVTLSLAFSMRKLMRQNTLPRTMHSCETMGAATVICTDKTGTLTQNQMQVAEVWHAPLATTQPQAEAQQADELLAGMLAVNTTANLDLSDTSRPRAIGNPTEGALLLWLHGQGHDYRRYRETATVEDQLPFSTENKYMATIVRTGTGDGRRGHRLLCVKGAPEIVMGLSDISSGERQACEQRLLEWQGKAMRTLAVAYKELADDEQPLSDKGTLSPLATGLRLAALFAIADPVRREVPLAIRECLEAGIQVKIVTGDTPGTAREIGRQTGLWSDADGDLSIMTGTAFAAMSDEQLKERVAGLKILSRARPADKERLVRLLRAQGEVVAVTGDGTNDAPALNAADVGLSMGDGTAVAKEASDMTIQDNSFTTIARAVMWGRSLYKNIQRFVMFQMTINVVACLIVLVGAFTGTQSPLTVTQMLWVNLIMDTFAAIALASLPPQPSVMHDRPRTAADPIISRAMARNIVMVGGLFTATLLALLFHLQRDGILMPYELSFFFTTFVMLQFWNIFNAKAFMTRRSAFHRLRECRGFMAIVAIILVGQVLIVELGGQMFSVTHLHLADWIAIIAGTSPVLWAGELLRLSKKTNNR